MQTPWKAHMHFSNYEAVILICVIFNFGTSMIGTEDAQIAG